MKTRPATFAIIEEMLVFLEAMRERQDPIRPGCGRSAP